MNSFKYGDIITDSYGTYEVVLEGNHFVMVAVIDSQLASMREGQVIRFYPHMKGPSQTIRYDLMAAKQFDKDLENLLNE